MEQMRFCGQCGTAIPSDAPGGQCPHCLFAAGIAPPGAEGEQPAGDSVTGATVGGGPLSAERVAAAFPQLEILELIGEGGMGVVYRARQRSLERIVALKLLPPGVASDPAFAERFAREARALARLNHPSIVGVHEAGESHGLYYLIMEFVDGVDLRRAQRAGRLSPAEALRIVPQICDALQYAHDCGVVHRDIKPENILIDRQGRVKIADFGLAKIVGGAASERSLTRPTQVMGTYHYMAPEQINAPKEVDHRADIYSLGVVFYEMLTGELPIGRFPPPSQKVAVDVKFDRVVLRALETERERRYQHASEVKSDVSGIRSVGFVPEAAAPEPGEPAGADRWDRSGEAWDGGEDEPARLSLLVVAGWLLFPASIMLGVASFAMGVPLSGAITIGVCGGLTGLILCIMGLVSIHHNPGLRGRGLALAPVVLVIVGIVLVPIAGFIFAARSRESAIATAERDRRMMVEQMRGETWMMDDNDVEIIGPDEGAAQAPAALEDLLRELSVAGEDRSRRAALVDPTRREWFLALSPQEYAVRRLRDDLGLAGVDLGSLPAPLESFQAVSFGPGEGGRHPVIVAAGAHRLEFPVIEVDGELYLAIGRLVRDPP